MDEFMDRVADRDKLSETINEFTELGWTFVQVLPYGYNYLVLFRKFDSRKKPTAK